VILQQEDVRNWESGVPEVESSVLIDNRQSCGCCLSFTATSIIDLEWKVCGSRHHVHCIVEGEEEGTEEERSKADSDR
jgi:hypothetical protein